MSYDVADLRDYTYTDATFGATTVTHTIQGPKGKVGFVREISCDVATNLVGTTTVPEIDVGISSGDFTYGRYRLGSAAGTGYNVGYHSASQEAIVGNPPRTLGDFSGHVVLDGGPLGTSGSVAGGSSTTVNPAGRIPANATVIITSLAGTGGSPAGGGQVKVRIQWLGAESP